MNLLRPAGYLKIALVGLEDTGQAQAVYGGAAVRIDWLHPNERVDGLTTASVLRWSTAGLDPCHDEFASRRVRRPCRTAVVPFKS
jgi:hypothetical protein